MKYKQYFIVSILALFILGVVYYMKGFFPFGDNYIIWGDMHGQIVPLYYKFYDAFYQNSSLFIDFFSGGGISLLGIFSYYLTSPFTFLVLLFPRDMIVHVPTIIAGLKIMLCAITCLYFLRKHFQKVPQSLQVLLSLFYAFSMYNLAHYIITGWIDAVYLFPLLMSGLKDLIDGKRGIFYTIILTLSFIMNFYITFMILLFIVIGLFLYFNVYKVEYDKQKKVITSLGMTTLAGLLISCFLLIPTFLQLNSSIRLGFDFSSIMNSRFGPAIDKISYLFGAGVLVGASIFILWKDKNEKYARFSIVLFLLLGLPLLIEPINKMCHFGSYIYYPCRFGFIITFVLIVLSSICFSKLEPIPIRWNKKVALIGGTILLSLGCLFLVNKYYYELQNCVTNLTFTKDKKMFLLVFVLFLLSVIFSIVTLSFSKKSKIGILCLWIFSLVIVGCNTITHLGIDVEQKDLKVPYQIMTRLYNDLPEDTYRVKLETLDINQNYGMVISRPTLDHFTSLTGESSFIANQKLGYDSYWMDTLSNGGNLFIDTLFMHRYLLTDEPNSFYENIYQYDYLYLQKNPLPMSYAYLLDDNIDITQARNSFEVTNLISNAIFKDSVFTNYELDKDSKIITKSIAISGKKSIYLEISNGYINSKKQKIYHSFNIYVDNELVYQGYPNKHNMNSIYLGTYDKDVTVKIENLNDVEVDYIALGILDLSKVEECFSKVENPTQIDIIKSKISVQVENQKNKKYVFIPINYLEGMTATNNGKNVDMIKVMDNYIGIPLMEGNNDITISYHTRGLKLGIMLSIIGFLFAVFYLKYLRIVIPSGVKNICFIGFYGISILALSLIYVIPFIGFLLSFI